jgi:Lar family restriction alleviation protein
MSEDKLLPCPFCGGKPSITRIGNNYTKTRKVKIKCQKCRIQRVDAARIHDMEWAESVAVKNWNMRAEVE